MPKRPRRGPTIQDFDPPRKKEEFRNCDGPGCRNIISVDHLPRSYSGPVFCLIHRDRYVKD